MSVQTPRAGDERRLADLLESVNLSPGERARARARIEQVEAFLDGCAALARTVRSVWRAIAAALDPSRKLEQHKPAHS